MLVALMMGMASTAVAVNDPVITQPLLGRNGQFKVDSSRKASDTKYHTLLPAVKSGITNNSMLNMVGLGIDEQSGEYIRSNFSVNVTLLITTYNQSDAVSGSFSKTFTVNYDTTTGAKYKSFDYYTFSGAFGVDVKITSIDSGTVNWPVSRVLKIENQITPTRDYPFNCNLDLKSLGTSFNTVNNELEVNWLKPTDAENPGVTEYDLEWAWIDEGAIERYMSGSNYVQELLFANNASRVSIAESGYKIPMLYDDEGRVFIRVRPVQVTTSGQRVEGKWTWIANDVNQPEVSASPVFYEFDGHEGLLNWQASTSFAEEGKRKSVVQYFDGSLRSRQTVTKDNTSNTTVVAESFYDYQGRAVIQVLPSPTLNTAIAYAKNFNRAPGEMEYPKSVYDKLIGSAGICGNPASPFHTDFGTAKYYSAKNPSVSDGVNKYIPDATAGNPDEGYPFTETRLSPDGRIASQGGVGAGYQIGSGHETKYYYETPTQEELDALFGTDAGVASHYFKNAVQDANGQFSVSYTDMHGRTVATALAGEAPKNADGSLMLDELDSKTSQLFTKQLIDKETNTIIGNSIVSSKPIVVMKDNSTYTFNYTLNPQQLNLLSCTNEPVCYDCLYKLKFTITSDCDKQVVYEDSLYNFTLGQYINQCNANGNASQGFAKSFIKTLNTGSYTVTKTLTLSSEAQAAYRDKFLEKDTCKKLVEFYQQELQLVTSGANCNITCASCTTAIGGTLNGFIQKFADEMQVPVASLSQETKDHLKVAYNEALANCQRICDNNDGMDIIRNTRQMMLLDVTPPRGQYARLESNYTQWQYNIFKNEDASNSRPPYAMYGIVSTKPDYLQPRSFDASDQAMQGSKYLDEFNLEFIPDANLTPAQFTAMFKTPWANQLLVHHPEFKKLQLCENQLKPAFKFEADLEKENKWAQAKLAHSLYGGYNYITNLIDADPLFSIIGQNYKNKMLWGNYIAPGEPPANANLDVDPVVHGINRYLLPHTPPPSPNPPSCSDPVQYAPNYATMWQIALGTVFCRDKADGASCTLDDLGNLSTKAGCTMNPAYAQPPVTFNEGCETDRDWAWKVFKNLYLAERRKLIAAYLNELAPAFIGGVTDNTGNLAQPLTYQERFINYANPKGAFENLNISGAGDVANIINIAAGNLNAGNYQAQQLALQQYDETCRGYASTWIAQLKACPEIEAHINNSATWPDDYQWLMNRLVAICKKGADNSHPLGSSTVNPNGPPAIVDGEEYRDFEKVVREFLQYKLGTSITTPYTAECFPWLINTPKPYEKQKALTNTYVLTKPSDCECERITGLESEWSNQTGFTGTFAAYLQYKHGTYISSEQLDALLALCHNNYQCKMLEKPITLPPALQCPPVPAPAQAPKTCITCAEYQDLRTAFRNITNVEAPFANPETETEISYNASFAAFANNQTGFSKTWLEYVAFQRTCDAANPDIPCESLNSTLTAFYASPEYLANPLGLPCMQAFTNYFNSHYNLVLTFDQWMAKFRVCGNEPNVCKTKITCESFSTLIEGYYNQYGVQIYNNSNCQSLFTNYINTQLTSNYTFAQLQAIYNTVCGGGSCGGLNVCEFPNNFLLNRVYNAFKAANPQPWNLPDCQQAFADFFNNYFGLVPAWELHTIQSLYKNGGTGQCVPSLNELCTPPYSCEQLNQILELFLKSYDPAIQPDCQQAFAAYFNQQMGTNYTYAQIAAFYSTICRKTLTVCDPKLDCKDLILFANENICRVDCSTYFCHEDFLNNFNNHFSTFYTSWDDLVKLYAGCDYDLNIVCGGANASLVDAQSANLLLEDFKKEYPDPATQLEGKCEDFFASVFNEKFGTKYSYAQVAAYYLQQCSITLDICTSACSRISSFITGFTGSYNSLKLPAAAREDLFAFAYNKAFLQGGSTEKQLEQTGDATLVFIDQQTDTKSFDPLVNYPDIQKAIDNCGLPLPDFTPAATISIYDPQVLLSLKQVYYLLHPIGLPEKCQQYFAGWFNRVMKTQYDYKQLLVHYNSVCGNNSGYICEAVPGGSNEISIYVKLPGTNPANATLPPLLCGLNEPGGGPVLWNDNPCKDLEKIAYHYAIEKYELYVDSLRNVFDLAYRNKCLAAKNLESFTVTYNTSEYHYTLYYYDQAGSLVQTVPPAGVNARHGDAAFLSSVKAARAAYELGQTPPAAVVPAHTLVTKYRYNTLGQVVMQTSPDGGTSRFWYDRLGRLAISQNQKQGTSNQYSYTLYDELGRIKEVGQLTNATAITQAITRNGGDATAAGSLANWLNNKPAEQITRTYYDKSYLDGQATLCPQYICQTNLRNRVSYTAIYDAGVPGGMAEHTAATYYSYDIHGNVYELLQDYNSGSMKTTGNRFKKLAYKYDLISGKVNEVAYQPGDRDAFYHRYSYDAENRLTDVETSTDHVYWQKDARYKYYKHGPLARTILGQQQVQGVDYAYTLQGWLKGINSTAVGNGTFDMGGDGNPPSGDGGVARDVYGFSLNYYSGDYKPINIAAQSSFVTNTYSFTNSNGKKAASPLYNGNIAAMLVNIPKLGDAHLYAYRYDQLNRIVSMDAFTGLTNSTNLFAPAATNSYKERVSYDANGNIKTYLRNGDAARQYMDNMVYSYKAGTNQLDRVVDAAPDAAGNYSLYNDLKRTQPNGSQGQATGNYTYDAIGNLVIDVSEGIYDPAIPTKPMIEWTVYGKISKVTKIIDGQTTTITYTYDAAGNRVSKTVQTPASGTRVTWYVRDASGNVMALYEKRSDLNSNNLTLTELHEYGSSRLGILNVNRDMQTAAGTTGNANFETGNKFFELSNHLGNVLVTITDKKRQHSSDGITVDYYFAEIASANDYYPFGMAMPGRNFSSEKYRYGFNGKEKDKDMNSLTAYDYGFRIYNPAIGKFLSVDPLTKNYAMLTPYQFASNNPIEGVDMDGLEYVSSKDVRIEVIYGKVVLKVENMTNVVRNNLNYYSKDPKNWNGKLGVDMSIGDINIREAVPPADPGTDTDPSDANDPKTLPPGEIKVGTNNSKSTNQPDKRFTKQRTVAGAVPGGAKGIAIATVAAEIIIWGANQYISNKIEKDQNKIEDHVNKLNLAIADVNYVLKNTTLIPPELQTEQYLSDIINVVLSGESVTKQYHPDEGAKVLEIGQKIYNTYSVKRNEYTGKMINTCAGFSGCTNLIQERNPNFDPEYVEAASVTKPQKKPTNQ